MSPASRYRALRSRGLCAVAFFLAAVLVAVSVAVVLVRPRTVRAAGNVRTAGRTADPAQRAPARVWVPLTPSTTLPALSPAQLKYDQAFEAGLSSPDERAVMAGVGSIALPAPATGRGWPELAPAYSPGAWAIEFTTGLLDVDFAHQARLSLGQWLVAEEAPDLLPGVPARSRLGWLVATVLCPRLVPGSRPPLPGPARWAAYAAAGERWRVSDLHVQVDPQWQAMVAAGWQPVDLYASVQDVSGVLARRSGGRTTRSTFSLELQLGSARWHAGYGTVLVGEVG